MMRNNKKVYYKQANYGAPADDTYKKGLRMRILPIILNKI